MLTAGFGGSGVQEVDPELIARVPADPDGVDPAEDAAARNLRLSAAMNNGKTREEAEAIADRPQPPRQPITPEQAEAKGKLWTPGQESDTPGEKPSPIWTPAGAGGST